MPRHQQVLRQWKILRRLERAPSGISVAELAAEEQLGERSLYRDLEALQQAGFPLYSEDVDGQRRWRLTDAFRERGGVPLALSEVLALRCARSAFEGFEGTPFFDDLRGLIARLDALLAPELREFARQMDEVFVGDRFGRPDYGELEPVLDPLNHAAAESRTVVLRYRSQRGTESERRVDPYNLWVHRNVLYVVAWCHVRRAIRTFAVARIREVAITDERFTVQAGYDFDAFARERFRIMSEGQIQRVRLRFAPEAALYVRERTWHPSQTITPAADGGVELTMDVDGLAEIATWVLSFGPRATALEPPSLVERVRGELAAALERYPGGSVPG